MSPEELQSLRNMGALPEAAEDLIVELFAALEEADLLMDHCDDPTEWRERWAHLWGDARGQG